MKKALLILVLMLGLGIAQAQAAVPVIDGLLGAGADITEWNNNSYEYYLAVDDGNEIGVGDNYDISKAVLLQELGNGDASKNGVYFMLTTWATPPSLLDVDHISTPASLALFADFGGDGFPTNAYGPFPPDVQIYVTNVNDTGPLGFGPFTEPLANDKVYWCSGAAGSCSSANGTLIWDNGAATGSTPAGFQYARGADAIEMFLQTGTFGTPKDTQFPCTFHGTATYDDGTVNPDDIAMGSTGCNVIPEPSTMFLTATGLISLLGAGKFKFWN